MGQTGTKKDEDETTPPQAEEDETTATSRNTYSARRWPARRTP